MCTVLTTVSCQSVVFFTLTGSPFTNLPGNREQSLSGPAHHLLAFSYFDHSYQKSWNVIHFLWSPVAIYPQCGHRRNYWTFFFVVILPHQHSGFWIKQSQCDCIADVFNLLHSSLTVQSINTNDPVPLAATCGHTMTSPPPCLTNDVICFSIQS